MKTRVCLTVLFVGLSASLLLAQGFGMRPGAWEYTMTMTGALSLEGIPPAARAQIEAEMRKPQVFQGCVTAEDLKTLKLGKSSEDDDEDCKIVSSKMTTTAGDVVRQCSGDEPRTETAHYEAPTPQTLRATITVKTADGTSTVNMTGKWVAAQCRE